MGCWRGFSPDPIQPVFVAGAVLNQLEQRVVKPAVAAYNPRTRLAHAFDQWFDVLFVIGQFGWAVQQGKSVLLAVQMEDRFIRQIVEAAHHRHGEVVYSRNLIEHCAGPRDQRVEISGQNAIHVAVLHQ